MNEWLTVTVLTLIFGLGGLVVIFIVFKPEEFLSRILEIFCTGVFICGVTLLLGETGALNKFINREIGRTVIDKITDPKFLTGVYSTERIKQIRMATTQAICRSTAVDTSKGSFLDLIEHTIYPMFDSLIHRYDLKVTYSLRIEEREGHKIFKVSHVIDCILKNPRMESTPFNQRISNTMLPVPGVEPRDLLRITEFTIDGQTTAFDLAMDTLDDGRYRFTGKCSILIEDKRIFHMKQEKFIPEDDIFTFWMTTPTKGVEVRFQHPHDYDPRLFVYGLGPDDPKHEVNEPELDVWRYDGWLLTRHGILLSWRKSAE